MKRALFRKFGRVRLLVHPTGAMPEDDWQRIHGQMKALGKPAPDERLIIWAEGKLDPHQRKSAKDIGGDRSMMRVLMFTNSIVTRGIVQALSWMGMKIRAFAKSDFDTALANDGFLPSDIAAVRAAIAEMEQELAAQP